jgi:hypothetical protein
MGASMNNYAKRGITFLVFICLAGIFGYNVRNFILSTRNPYIYAGAYADPDKIRAGDMLRTVYLFDHIRVCETKLARFVQNRTTQEIVFRDEIIGGAAPIGSGQAPVLKIPTDQTWAPGHYVARLVVLAQCPDDVHQYYAPDISFQVVE